MHQDQEQAVGRDCVDAEDDHLCVPVMPWCLQVLASCVEDYPHSLCSWLALIPFQLQWSPLLFNLYIFYWYSNFQFLSSSEIHPTVCTEVKCLQQSSLSQILLFTKFGLPGRGASN